jgi:plasmid stabilization system protein ParE
MEPSRPLNLRYTSIAATELAALLDYIRHQSPTGADKVAARLQRLIAMLPEFPQMGRATQMATLRVLAANPYPYLIFYEVADDELIIIGFRHALQDPDTHPGR